MSKRLPLALILLLIVAPLSAAPPAADNEEVPRMPSGKPNFTGVYDAGTVTPVDRPAHFGDELYLTPEAAKALEDERAKFWTDVETSKSGGADREAPPKGGNGDNRFGGGGVGGYNAFWIDPGSDAVMVDGKFRTSIIYEPKNGRRPSMTPAGMKKMMTNFASFAHNNDGTASWLDKEGTGPFDGPETLALAERCILGFSGGPPMLPSLYNNYLRIVQAEDYVMIMAEMVHDARVVKIDGDHGPEDVKEWLGDSIGYWDGETLVVETKNFRDETGLYGGDENLHIEERFSFSDNGNLNYHFRVNDPTAWTGPWAGEYEWTTRNDSHVYEYACHEGNYAMGNILRGARLLESEYDNPPKSK